MNCRLLFGFAFGVVFALSTCAFAADPAAPSISSKASSSSKTDKVDEPKAEMVELFAAAAKGDIDVKLIM